MDTEDARWMLLRKSIKVHHAHGDHKYKSTAVNMVKDS